MYGSNQRGGSGGGPNTLDPSPSKNLLGHSYKILIYQRNPQLKPSRFAPFLGNLDLGGGSVDMSKSQRHTRSGAGRGVSQANGAAIHPKLPGLCQHKIVEFKKKGSNVRLCKPVVGAW